LTKTHLRPVFAGIATWESSRPLTYFLCKWLYSNGSGLSVELTQNPNASPMQIPTSNSPLIIDEHVTSIEIRSFVSCCRPKFHRDVLETQVIHWVVCRRAADHKPR
jgi:hypothetical protein